MNKQALFKFMKPFCLGYQYGKAGHGPYSAREVEDRFGIIDSNQITEFQNGNEDGLAGDSWRYYLSCGNDHD